MAVGTVNMQVGARAVVEVGLGVVRVGDGGTLLGKWVFKKLARCQHIKLFPAVELCEVEAPDVTGAVIVAEHALSAAGVMPHLAACSAGGTGILHFKD